MKTGKKESLAWTVYAWCLQSRNRRDQAVAVLKRGVDKVPADARLKANLELASENKKIKVAPYGDKWAAFMLDGSLPGVPDNVPKFARGFAQRPGFRQRPSAKAANSKNRLTADSQQVTVPERKKQAVERRDRGVSGFFCVRDCTL